MEEPQGLTRRPTGWFGSAGSRRGRDTLSPMDTHAAVRMLTAAGADETLAIAMVDVAQNAAADHGRESSTRSDLAHLREVQRADLAALEARLTWRFAGAMLAQTLTILGGVVAILRLLGSSLPTDGGRWGFSWNGFLDVGRRPRPCIAVIAHGPTTRPGRWPEALVRSPVPRARGTR